MRDCAPTTADAYRPAVGSTFVLGAGRLGPLPLTLAAVREREDAPGLGGGPGSGGGAGSGGGPGSGGGAGSAPVPGASGSFSLLFHGSADTVLPQGTYGLTHDDLGEIALFVVPVGRDAARTRYEAVFG